MISSTYMAYQLIVNTTGYIKRLPLTELFKPLSDSFIHLRKSCEGGAGESSVLEVVAGTALTTCTAGGRGEGIPFERPAAGKFCVEDEGGARVGVPADAGTFPL